MGSERYHRAGPVGVVNVNGDDQGIQGVEIAMVYVTAPSVDMGVGVHIAVKWVPVVPLCEERPKGALETPVGVVSWIPLRCAFSRWLSRVR